MKISNRRPIDSHCKAIWASHITGERASLRVQRYAYGVTNYTIAAVPYSLCVCGCRQVGAKTILRFYVTHSRARIITASRLTSEYAFQITVPYKAGHTISTYCVIPLHIFH